MTGAAEWAGRVGETWAQEWRRTDRALAPLSLVLDATIAAAAPAGPFRALDVGCGAGATSAALLAARPDAAVVAVDLSPALAEVARVRVPAAQVVTGDALALAGAHGPFDLIVSRHGLMFFAEPVAALAALRAAAAPGAALVFSCFRDWRENGFCAEPAAVLGFAVPVPGAPGPFAFADAAQVGAMLAAAGWREAAPRAIDFPYRVGTTVDEGIDLLSRIGPAARTLRDASAAARPAMIERLRGVLAARAGDDGVDFPAAAWLWTARA